MNASAAAITGQFIYLSPAVFSIIGGDSFWGGRFCGYELPGDKCEMP